VQNDPRGVGVAGRSSSSWRLSCCWEMLPMTRLKELASDVGAREEGGWGVL
jgi:hypothetical protein